MKILIPLAVVLLLAGCAPRISLSDYDLPVMPADDLILPYEDTTITGTVAMLSDKFQALDVVEIEGDSAVRRARITFDTPIQPYHGGVITARVKVIAENQYGYVTRTHLLEWSEDHLDYQTIETNLSRLIRQQHRRLVRLIGNEGFSEWDFSGTPTLEGYDAGKNILIFSMASRAVEEPLFERQPVLSIWTTPRGKLLRVELMICTRFLERSQM